MAFLASHWLASLLSLLSVTGLGALSFFFPAQALGVVSWILRQRLATLGCIVLAVLLLIDHGALLMAHKGEASAKQNLVKCGEQSKALSEKLRQISNARNQQKIITQDRIVQVTRTVHDADVKARQVETAPAAPDCHTNKAVLDADV